MKAFIEHISAGWSAWAAMVSWQLALLVFLIVIIAFLARRFSARFRYILWLLVIIKVFIPPAFAPVWGVGNWAIQPLWYKMQRAGLVISRPVKPQPAQSDYDKDIASGHRSVQGRVTESTALDKTASTTSQPSEKKPPMFGAVKSWNLKKNIFAFWLAGLVVFLAFAVCRYWWLVRSLRKANVVDEGPLRVELERLALQVGKNTAPDLLLSENAQSPFLFGLFTARIVLPANLPETLNQTELRNVLLHELIHWKRRDMIVGWLQLLAQAICWFHPAVWFANSRIRHERECACDEAAIAYASCEPKGYGESLLKVLLAGKARTSTAFSILGIFERNTKLQNRLKEIMNYKASSRKFGMWGWAVILLFAMVFLSMSATRSSTSFPRKRVATEKQTSLTVPEDYLTIQSAIMNAPIPCTIYVHSGTYEETITMREGIDLVGENPLTTIIDGGDTSSAYTVTCTDHSTISGFTITGGYRGINCYGASPVIKNCIIRDNAIEGIHMMYSKATISQCIFSSNRYGIYVYHNSQPTITNCTISDNRYTGVSIVDAEPIITNCIISFNGIYGIGEYTADSDPEAVTNCCFYNNTAVDYWDEADTNANYYGAEVNTIPEVSDCIAVNPCFMNRFNKDYHLSSISPCIDAGDNSSVDELYDFDGNLRRADGFIDIGAYEFQD